MFLLDPIGPTGEPDLIITASDVVNAAKCEYQVLRKVDERLGRTPKAEFAEDEMLRRAAELGDVHEQRVLAGLREQYGDVAEIDAVAAYTRAELTRVHEATVEVMASGAPVIFQASFFDGVFHGRSDFLVREDDGAYAVWDSKLARRAKTEALLQLAAYADQVIATGTPVSATATLVLGDGTHSEFALAELLPVYRERRVRLASLIASHRAQPDPVAWGDDDVLICGRCDYCAEQVAEHRDVLGVHRVSLPRRRKLRDEGIFTIEDLARSEPEPGTAAARLRDQARMQAGLAPVDGHVQVHGKQGTTELAYRVLPTHTLASIPHPSPGDIFFDFEGDPLWQDDQGVWGLEYLFGIVEAPVGDAEPVFRTFLAHSRQEEGEALQGFLEYVANRRRAYPDMHIYHYAAYERSALQRLSAQHVLGEAAVDDLLREGVLVDLYDVVQTSLRLSAKSYGLKTLEPLYMGADLRGGDVVDAGASVIAYANYSQAVDNDDPAQATEILDSILDYNHYDCRSTLGLRDWLAGLAAQRGVSLGARPEAEPEELREPEVLPAQETITAHLRDLTHRPEAERDHLTERALAMVAAAVQYHRREEKQYWWGHFDRLDTPTADWAHTRDCVVADSARLVSGWRTEGRSTKRVVELRGTLADGSLIRPGSSMFRMYERPFPLGMREFGKARSGAWGGVVKDLQMDTQGATITVEENLPRDVQEYQQLPMAMTPDAPIQTKSLQNALAEVAQQVADRLPELPANPGLDLLRRLPPRLAGGSVSAASETSGSGEPALPPVAEGDYVTAITAAAQRLDRSYLAVQGPPGSGKTYVGARVISRLVADGWKVGVVAQSHAVVENLLAAAMRAGVPASSVVKKPGSGTTDVPWTGGSTNERITEALDGAEGVLIGGTAWTFTGRAVAPGALDLIVIDEAGQFSLANTLAVCRAASRLLLLGDPQQLPQVSQGTHPEPIDTSALAWLSAGDDVLPAHLGYFLARSWRMHPDLCHAVSELSYAGRLESAPATTQRELIGIEPGVVTKFVSHSGNTTYCEEEAAEVVSQVKAHLGLSWRESAGAELRPLGPADVLVVAPYNAQVQLILQALHDAGLPEVRVGTVDKFQGQQAPVVIVSMTVSAVQQAPRGMEFVLNRNRVNVAISRGQWRAVIVRSPALTDALPYRPEQLGDLGAFIRLCGPAPAG